VTVSITTYVHEQGAEYVAVRVFAGPTGGTRALCGVLTMRREEAREFEVRIADREEQQ
jgi:predicted subunit of tRNA(5-methylaminomethyl-2-thiouridylate) methyltransferase